jgi:hypothetical protein
MEKEETAAVLKSYFLLEFLKERKNFLSRSQRNL